MSKAVIPLINGSPVSSGNPLPISAASLSSKEYGYLRSAVSNTAVTSIGLLPGTWESGNLTNTIPQSGTNECGFTLSQDKTYMLVAAIDTAVGVSEDISLVWYDETNSQPIDTNFLRAFTNTSTGVRTGTTHGIVRPETDIDVRLYVYDITGNVTLYGLLKTGPFNVYRSAIYAYEI